MYLCLGNCVFFFIPAESVVDALLRSQSTRLDSSAQTRQIPIRFNLELDRINV